MVLGLIHPIVVFIEYKKFKIHIIINWDKHSFVSLGVSSMYA